MITKERKNQIKRLSRAISRKTTEVEALREALSEELYAANQKDNPKATLDELGKLIGVSRQRVHQLIEKATK